MEVILLLETEIPVNVKMGKALALFSEQMFVKVNFFKVLPKFTYRPFQDASQYENPLGVTLQGKGTNCKRLSSK